MLLHTVIPLAPLHAATYSHSLGTAISTHAVAKLQGKVTVHVATYCHSLGTAISTHAVALLQGKVAHRTVVISLGTARSILYML
jgi:hypothetical protein